jgi:hypothetical protein
MSNANSVERLVRLLAPHEGLHSHRLRCDDPGLELEFAALWAEWCRGRKGINSGVGTFDMLTTEPHADDPLMMIWRSRRPTIAVDDSHKAVAATVVQWLGTNIGQSFIHEAMRRAGYKVHLEKLPNTSYTTPPVA